VHRPGEQELEALRLSLVEHTLPHLQNYIWQRDSFNLVSSASRPPPWRLAAPKRKAATDAWPPCLWGATCFGDNIDDEWFIVWLLRDLTCQFTSLSVRWGCCHGNHLQLLGRDQITLWHASRVLGTCGDRFVSGNAASKARTSLPFLLRSRTQCTSGRVREDGRCSTRPGLSTRLATPMAPALAQRVRPSVCAAGQGVG
jgi:SGT1 protein